MARNTISPDLSGTVPAADVTVRQLADAWLAQLVVGRPSTEERYRRWMNEFVRLHGDRPARSIVRLDTERFRRDLATRRDSVGGLRYRPCTINQAFAPLRCAWDWAMRSGVLPFTANPFRLRGLVCPPRRRVLTSGEFQSLLRHSVVEFRRFLLAVRFTGTRPGQVRLLRWQDVDWQRRCFRSGRPGHPGHVVRFPPLVGRLLQHNLQAHGHDAPAAFLDPHGRPWTAQHVERHLARARLLAGIGLDEHGEALRLDDFRRAYARAAIDLGVAPVTLGSLLGYRVRHDGGLFVHVDPQAVLATADAVAAALMPPHPSDHPA